MARVIIDKNGTKKYFNDTDHLHRKDGPAYILRNGSMDWYVNGNWKCTMWASGNYLSDMKTGGFYKRLPNGYKEYLKNGEKLWPELP